MTPSYQRRTRCRVHQGVKWPLDLAIHRLDKGNVIIHALGGQLHVLNVMVHAR